MRLSNIALSLTALYGAGGFARGSSLALDFISGNRTLDPRITFSRTTNATVTGSNGLIQNAPMNLLTFSEQFDNAAWVKTSCTVTANAAMAPNGTMTADRAVFTSGGLLYVNGVPASAGTYVFSGYVKSATGSPQTMRIFGNGTLNYSGNLQVTTDWTRVSFTFTYSAPTSGFATSPSQPLDIFIWGAQLELGSTATTYNPTTVKNLLGFTENFDNAAWTKSNAFVQTNFVPYSQDFDNASWAKTAATVTANSIVAPDGSTTGDKLAEDATTSIHNATNGVATAISSTAYTGTVYVKAAERQFAFVGLNGGGIVAFASIDLSTGAVSVAAGSPIVSATSVGNGWYRVSVTATTASTAFLGVDIRVSADGVWANRSYTGTAGSGIFIWGAQLVQGTSAGDYKATYATAAAVGYTDIYGQPFAQKLVATADNSQHIVVIPATTSAAPFTANIYAKAAERNFLFIRMNNVNNTIRRCWFNLATGVVGTVNSDLTAAITDVGNGWYRCSVTVNSAFAGSQNIGFGLSDADNVFTYTGDGTSGIYIFGAQLSDSASVDPYVYNPVAAPTSTAYYGPRFDYDPVTLAPKGLLIEEQRTNLLLRSEEFDNASWTKSNATVTSNTTVSPDGTVDADMVTDTATNANHGIYGTGLTVTATTSYAMSVYLKAGTLRYVSIRGEATGAGAYPWVTIDLQTGSLNANTSVASASSVAVGNGWYRLIMTFVNQSLVAGGANVVIAGSNVSTAPLPASVLGNVYLGTGSTFYVWGAQLEAGAFATSYIPTVASQVTRAADSASMIGNNFARWYNPTEGTMFADIGAAPAGSLRIATISDGGINNQIWLGTNLASNNVFFVYTNGAFVAQINLTPNSSAKTAGAFATDDFACSVNGGAVATDTSGAIATSYSRLNVGTNYNSSAGFINGTIKRISYYPRRLANSEIQGITS
jgi:hypothetical protein